MLPRGLVARWARGGGTLTVGCHGEQGDPSGFFPTASPSPAGSELTLSQTTHPPDTPASQSMLKNE